MAKRPEQRPMEAITVVEELARLPAGASETGVLSTLTAVLVPAPKRRRPALAWGLLALVPLIGLGVWLMNRPGPATVAPAAEPIKGSVDLMVYRIDDKGSDGVVPLSDPRAMPLRKGDEFRIEAVVNRPAYLYLFWVDEDGKGVPVYPWTPGKWDTRPAIERPMTELKLLAPNGKGFTISGDADGMETIMMLARSEKLEASVEEVKGWFTELKPLPFRGPEARVWFENFDIVRDDVKRGFKIDGDVAAVDGPRGLQLALKQKIGSVELARAISFARVGPKK